MSTVAMQVLEGLDAESAFARLAERTGAYWLDNAFRARPTLSALGAEPTFVLCWDAEGGLRSQPVQPDWLPPSLPPLEALRRVTALTDLPRTQPGREHADIGNAGCIGYEIGCHLEPSVLNWPGEPRFPTVYWAWYDRHLTWNPVTGRLHAVAGDWPLWDQLGLRLAPPEVRVQELAADLRLATGSVPDADNSWRSRTLPPVGEFDPAEYCSAVARVIDYIRAGDIFQANLSQRFRTQRPLPNPVLYRRLRRLNRAPHSAYLGLVAGPPGAVADAPTVMSASPELFLSVDYDGQVLTRPIKGTRPRGADDDTDRRLAAELAASPKDAAELVMIVDLLRNDLGRVCRYGSVQVTAARQLESYSTVHHMVASVTGRLRPNRDRFDLLAGCLPGGSITGAPKVRAMQILRELERSPRRVYTGCIGCFGSGAELDLNIAIRTLMSTGGIVSFGVGGGIVADSDPESEYQETLHKAEGLIRALLVGHASVDPLELAAGAGA